MAFNEKEQEIIRFGIKSGKSPEEIKEAIVNMRVGYTPPTEEPSQPATRSTAQDLGIGAAKGLGSTLKLAQDVAVQAPKALLGNTIGTPVTKALKAAKDKFQSTVGLTDENLQSDNPAQMVGKGIEIGAEILTPLVAGRVASLGLSTGKKVGEALADTTKGTISQGKSWLISDAPLSVENVLKETSTKQFDEYVAIAQKATENNKNITPLEFAGKRAQAALDQIDRKTTAIGQNKSAIINSSAGRIPVGNIVVKYRQQLQNSLANKTAVEGDQKVYRDVLSEAQRLGDNPSAADVDRFIDFVQDRIYTAKRDLSVPVTDDVQSTLRPITGQLNEALKTKLPDSYRTLNQQYSDLIEIRNELNTKLGIEGEKGGALMKRVFSPSDANTKELFADVLDVTGVDLVNEATLARYAMDTLGDARQKNMLEQLKLVNDAASPSGVMALVEKARQLIDTPTARLNKARKLTKPQDANAAFGAATGITPNEEGEIDPQQAIVGAMLGIFGKGATKAQFNEALEALKKSKAGKSLQSGRWADKAIEELKRQYPQFNK